MDEAVDNLRDHTAVLQTWLEQLRSADGARSEEARRAVINHAADRLEKLARKMLANYPRLRRWEQTGDVLQNAVLRLHRSLTTIRPESVRQFYGLAATMIRRELIDMTRHHFGPKGAAAKHHTDGPNAINGTGSSVERQPDTRGEPSSLTEWTDFHDAVERLPEAERAVFDLYWYGGLDQKTIASILNISDRTVKNRWRGAKLLLRRLLADDAN